MKTIIAGLLSFMVGSICYILTLKLVWNESLGGDANIVFFWGGSFFFFFAFPIYIATILFVDLVSVKHKLFFYPLGCMFVIFIPISFFMGSLGGESGMFSHEAMLIYSFFLPSGLIFGIISWFFRRKIIGNN